MEDVFAMMRNQSRQVFMFMFILTMFLLRGNNVSAQYAPQPTQWAVKMFSELGTERAHDFGSVALHAEVVHRFAFKNIYQEEVEIASAQSNCGCTKVSVSRRVIPSGEMGEIIARVDTSGKEHTKRRRATITVVFNRPAVAEVQLQVQTYIRSDVGFEPGTVDFGTVSQGRNLTKKVYLQYEGSPGWALTSIRKTSNTIKAEAREVRRQGGQVLYEIDVSLVDDAPPGYLNGLLRFTTNETNSTATSIFLPIHGLIMEPLTAKPSCFQLGVVHPGEKLTKNLVIRGAKPFRIVQVSSPDSRIRFLVADDQSPVHVIPVTFTAGAEVGDIKQVISIKTDQTELPGLEVDVTGFVAKIAKRSDLPSKPAKKKSDENVNEKPKTTPQSVKKPVTPSPFATDRTLSVTPFKAVLPPSGKDGDSSVHSLLKQVPSDETNALEQNAPQSETVDAKPVETKPLETKPLVTKPPVMKSEQPKADPSGWTTVIGHKSGERIIR